MFQPRMLCSFETMCEEEQILKAAPPHIQPQRRRYSLEERTALWWRGGAAAGYLKGALHLIHTYSCVEGLSCHSACSKKRKMLFGKTIDFTGPDHGCFKNSSSEVHTHSWGVSIVYTTSPCRVALDLVLTSPGVISNTGRHRTKNHAHPYSYWRTIYKGLAGINPQIYKLRARVSQVGI